MGCRRSAALALAAALLGCCCLRPAPGRLVVLRRPDPAAAGGNVTFALEPAPAAFRLCTWYRGAEPDPQREIFTYFAGDPAQTDGAAFTGRESSGPDCSMHLRALRTADSGAYTVHLRLPDLVTAGANLTVYAPLPRPRVTPAAVTAPENDTFALACDRPAGAETLLWLRDGAALAAGGRLTLAGDNRTLTVTAAARTDAGAYACEVGNPVSRNRSEPANVTVLYGPDAVTVEPPGPLDRPAGSPLALTCAAASVPAPLYTWFFGNVTRAGATWAWERLGPAQRGAYVCRAQNPGSGQSRNSSVLELRVWELLPRPRVTPAAVTAPENDTFALACDRPAGAETLLWLRDGAALAAGGRLTLAGDNRTLTVTAAARTDAGAYACEVGNPVSRNRSEPANVTVLYGPDAVTVEPPGPLDRPAGSPLALTCAAASVPAPLYTWFFGNVTRAGATWAWERLGPAQRGAYVCRAQNPGSGQSRNSSVLELRVWELLPRPRVTPAAVTAPENDTFALACDRPAGAETLLWLRDGAALVAGGRLTLAGDNRTLTVTAAAQTDAGAYACEVGNPVSRNRSEPANVTVLYGPAAAAVSPPSPVRAPLGSRVELACAAAAVPPPRYRWDFGNATVGHQSRLAFVFEEASQAGEYRCVATNPALGRAAAATVLLRLPAGGLSPGAVAGAVLGSLLGLGLLAAAGFLLWRRTRGRGRRRGGPGTPARPPPAAPNGAEAAGPPRGLPSADSSPGTLEARTPGPLGPAAAPEEEEEIKYSTLAFRAPGAAARSPPRDGGTVYSEVKRR